MHDRIAYQGITFDDILLEPGYSELLPREVDIRTRLTSKIGLNLPILSSPMDTVTEAELAIALAQEGGLGVIHKNLSIDQQVREVLKVKRSANGIITDPVTLPPDAPVSAARKLMQEQKISGVPITENGKSDGKVVGILTHRDMKFLPDADQPIHQVMSKGRLITGAPNTTLDEAEDILNQNKVEKLLLVDDQGRLTGLITMRDIDKFAQFPSASRDTRGRLRVGAAVGVHQLDRVAALIDADVDLIIVDTAHGHSKNVLDTVSAIKSKYDIDVVAGNVASEQGAYDLASAGADAVKVGIGPGSICTTRVVTGVGVPQMTALSWALEGVARSKNGPVSIISDGGIRQSGDITKALAMGAKAVMLGSLFAGMDESPGELILHMGRRFKTYRGMGSQGAMLAGSADRYGQADIASKNRKLVPEGVEGRVPYRGPLSDFVYQLVGGLRAGMGYLGARTLPELAEKARFVRITGASLVESHPHDIMITKESPNYSVELRASSKDE